MNAYALNLELAAIQSRTRKVMCVSLAVHALLFLWLALHHVIAPPPPALTEITVIDPAPVTPPPVVAVKAPEPKERTLRLAHSQEPEHFVRTTSEADFSPRPQTESATDDLLQRKLAALERRATQAQASIADLVAPNAYAQPTLASVPSDAASARGAVSLTRKGTVSSSPIRLARSETRRAMPAAPLASAPARSIAPAKLEKTDSNARRIIDGASLVGPVADRPLLSYRKPEYPEWAKSEGVEATVNLYFVVLPSGAVKENVLIQKTSGFEDFDTNAVAALLTWRFEPLKQGETGEQWGSITFNYRLAD